MKQIQISSEKLKEYIALCSNTERTDKIKAIKLFIEWCLKSGRISEDEYLQLTPLLMGEEVSKDKENLLKSILLKLQGFKSSIVSRFQKLAPDDVQRTISTAQKSGLLTYVSLLALLLFIGALGAGMYTRFFIKPSTPFAYPTLLTPGSRTLSFQGRLTDSLGNPITTSTNVTFKLFDSSSNGNQLYTTGTCSLTPDQDGIFSTIIGQSCGSAIGSTVFSENANVYLETTVAGETLSPRQQIANVGYAINAENLQGFPPGTNTSNIPFINRDGDMYFHVANPGIRSSYASANFTLSSAVGVIVQSAGTGDITLTATGSGAINLKTANALHTTTLDTNGDLKIGGGTFNNPSGSEDLYVTGNIEADGTIYGNGSGLTSLVWSSLSNPSSSLSLSMGTNGTTFTWGQSTTNAFTNTFDSLSSGKGLYLSSAATALTGNVAEISLTGNNANNTGNLLRIGQDTTSSAAVPLMITNLGTGLSFRVNDETGDADTSPFVIDNSGKTGIGIAAPVSKLHVTHPLASGVIGKALAIFDQIENQDIFTASAAGTMKFTIANNGDITSYGGAKWKPTADSTTALNIANAAGTSMATFDTTNLRVGIGTTGPSYALDIINTATPQLRIGYDANNYVTASVASAGSTTFNTVGTPMSSSFAGTGADGDVTISSSKNLNTDTIKAGRSYADGIAYKVDASTFGSTTVTAVDTPSGLAAGDQVLLINLQGASGDSADVGKYEFLTLQNVNTGTKVLTFTTTIVNHYSGTTASNQKVVVQRVPQYANVTITSSGTLTASAWDGLSTTPSGTAGYRTGIVAFRATGTVSNSGTITASQLGYRGGAVGGNGPESYIGYQNTGGGNGGNGAAKSGITYSGGGGGGGGSSGAGGSSSNQTGGTAGSGGGGAGGNGANSGSVNGGNGSTLGGGGGGARYNLFSAANGGGGGAYPYSNDTTVTPDDFSKVYLGGGSSQGGGGGGGGEGGGGSTNGTGGNKNGTKGTGINNGSDGGAGTPGGGIVFIYSDFVNTTAGAISVNGGNGGNGGGGGAGSASSNTGGGGGGGGTGGNGGTGGAVYIYSTGAQLGSSVVTASAGAGGSLGSGASGGSTTQNGGTGANGQAGSAGTSGKIYVQTVSSLLAGSTSPTNLGSALNQSISPKLNFAINNTNVVSLDPLLATISAQKTIFGGTIQVTNPNGDTTAPSRLTNGEFAFAYIGAEGRLYFRSNNTNYYISKSGSGDYSEYFLKQRETDIIIPGYIVSLEGGRVVASSRDYAPLGVVSAFGTKNFNDGGDGLRHLDPKYVNVGLLGQLPVIVSSENGPILKGDRISVGSTLSGVGIKNNATAKVIVGRATQDFDPAHSNCPLVQSFENIQWPENLENANQDNICFQLPNGTYVGRIMAYVNPGWYDPDAYLTNSGQLAIIQNTANSDVYHGNLAESTNELSPLFSLQDAAGSTIEKTINASNAVLANVRSGLISSQEVITKNLSATRITAVNITSDTFSSVTGVFTNLTVNDKLTSPVVETEHIISTGSADLAQINTNIIKPQNSSLTIDLNPSETATSEGSKGPLASVIIRGREGKKVAELDSEGNATFSGTIVASQTQTQTLAADSVSTQSLEAQKARLDSLEATDASLSGKITAKDVQSENITKLTQDTQTLYTNVNQIQSLLADVQKQKLTDVKYYQNLGNSPISFDGSGNTIMSDNLTVLGDTKLYNASVANTFTAGNIFIQDNSILSLAWDLKLSALSTITLFDGSVQIARDGTITTQGTLIAKGGVKTDKLEATEPGKDLNVVLGSSTSVDPQTGVSEATNAKLAIQDTTGLETASIDASGSAQFKDISLKKFNDPIVLSPLENFQKNGLLKAGIETQDQSAGAGVVPTNEDEVVIYNSLIKQNSLVYLTPVENIPDLQLTVISKNVCSSGVVGCKPSFTVSSGSLNHGSLPFNWLVIN